MISKIWKWLFDESKGLKQKEEAPSKRFEFAPDQREAELLGTITKVEVDYPEGDDQNEWEYWKIVIQTDDYGIETGFLHSSFANLPKVGNRAVIRVHRIGGGWYPDNRIVTWWKAK